MRKTTPQLSSFARRLTLKIFLAICIIYSNFANAQLSVTSGTASQGYTLNAAATFVDPALTITSGSSISGFRVTISTGLQSSDVLACTGTVPSGVTVVPYNSSTGTLAFTGSTSAANWQTFLRSVTYRCTNTSQVGDRTITFSAGSSSAFTNGHYYELVSSSATWTAAKTAAEGRTYLGLTGYLATITSAAENTFIRQVLNADAWIGCSDDRTYINAATGTSTYANQSAAEGKWYWVTGPEKGTMFTVGNGSPVTQAGQYANWNSGEPNNSGGENYGEIYSSGSNPGAWNDLPNNSLPYVVEYGGLATDPVQTISANTTIYINITSNTASSAQTICNGASASALTGSTPAGGTGTYTYVWQSSTTSATSGFSTATGTSNAKNYTPASLTNSTWFRRIVTSGSAVDTTTAVKITVNSAITSSSSTTSVSCYNGSNGAGSVSVSGGTSPYFYSWAPSGGTGASASGLSAGSYTVTITDNVGCTANKSVTITQPASALSNTALSQTNVACNAGTTGAASVSVSGGTSPYTYSWSSGATSASISSLAAGTYTCTATDANSCTSARSFTITQPTAINTTPSSTNVACNGLSTGAASISVSGGTPSYTYQWSNGGSTSSKTGLAAGTYTVTVTDANACTSSRSFTITQPTALSTTPSSTDVSCNGGSNGVASVVATGGTPAYTYLWSNGGSTATKTGLTAGTYTCTVTDANACTSARSFTVTQPTALSTTPTSTDVACNGGSNGAASIAVSGGTSSYTYLWSNGGTTASNSGLSAGTYTCTVTDANSCVTSRSFTITQPTALSTTPSSTNVACNGLSTGAASISVSGGTSPYTYLWSNGGTSSSKTGLTAGTYTCTITDNNACTSSRSFTITEPTAIATTPSSTNVACNGGSNGAASVTVSGGTPAYTYLWSNGGTTASKTGLTAGTYTCTITDANACTSARSFTITQPAALSTTPTSINIACNGGSNGAASVAVTGGTSPYTYLWSNGGTTSSKTGLTAGTYTCTITDNNSCISSRSFTITEPTAISTTPTSTDVACNGGNTGAASVAVSGGTLPYTYLWSNGGTTASKTGLTAGTYTCTITDDNACTSSHTFTITEASAIAETTATTDVDCNGNNNGSATVSIAGGTLPYTVTWQSGATGAVQTSLTAGTYGYSITDGNGCLKTGSAIIGQPSTLVAAITSTAVLCHGDNNGTLDASATGGIAPYSYTWNHTTDISSSLSDQSAGSYSCVITDANGCTSTQSVIISEPTTLATTTTQTEVACNGGNNGVAEITANGGTSPYNYTWNHSSDNVSSFNDLSNGNYQCLITDANGCTTNASFVITEPTAITSTNSTIEPLCNGGVGEASIIASGGTGNLSYNWSNGTTASFDNNLTAGNYTVVITDDNGCSYSTSINITEPTAVQLTITTTDPLCHSGDGSATVTATGGTGAYTYDWSTGGNTDTESAIYAGSYSLTITDNNGCAYTKNFTINDPAAISTSFTTTSPLCNGGTGEATINASGGTGNLFYQWSTGGTATTESNLTAGTYQVQIIDDNGCIENSSVTISEPAAITYNATVNDEHCNQGNGSISLTATGGTGVLSYNWNTGSSDYEITSLSAGTFDFTIYDQNGCTIMNQVTINNISAPTVSSSTNNVLCNSDANGSIDLSVSGGTAVYNYTWSNGATTEDLSQLVAGTYDYTVTDDANCSTTGSITISEPSALATTVTSINETSGNDGSIDLSVTGGTAPYSYTWSTGENTEDISGLTAGNYVVNITDANGCNTSTSIDITSTVGLFQLAGNATQLLVKPNPSNGMLNIEGLSIGNCKIYDAAGRLINSFTNNSTEIKIDLTSLANGVYSIRNFSEKGNSIGRIIISK